MEEQVIELIKRFANELNCLREQQLARDRQIQSLTEQLETEIALAKHEAKTLFQQKQQEREKFLLGQFEKQKQ